MYVPKDPLGRFVDVFTALNAERGWFTDASPLRFAAMAALTCDGTAEDVARSIRAVAKELAKRSGWFGELNGALRFIVAAMLVQSGDTAEGFMAEIENVRELMRKKRLSRGGAYEVIATLILRGRECTAVQPTDIERFKAIHEEMKRYHWWLTGVDDYPACAILTRQPGTPEAIGMDVEAIYQELNRVGFKKGGALQTASNLLYLAGGKPSTVAARFFALYEAFRSERTRIWQSEYDELAILSFLKQPASDVVESVLQSQVAIRELSPRPDRALAFNLASSVSFLELVQVDPDIKDVSDAKAMMDMQAIIAAQQAAATAAIVSSTGAAAAASSASS